MRGRPIVAPALMFLCMTILAGELRGHASNVIGEDYVLALSTANRFLCAWQMRGQEEGLALLSSRLKSKYSEDDLRFYISGISNPHHAAFEVGPGKCLPDGRYVFEVRFYQHYTSEKESFPRPEPMKIVLVQTGPEDWLVDELPAIVPSGQRLP